VNASCPLSLPLGGKKNVFFRFHQLFVMIYLKKPCSLLPAVLLFLSGHLSAQLKVQLIPPAATDKQISEVHSPHIALYNPSRPSRYRLVLMIQGTGASAVSCRAFDSCIAAMGYPVISIDYPNNVITTVCSTSADSSCFDGFRKEIVFGTACSPVVEVDSANSLVHRFTTLLLYLSKHDKAGRWNEFLRGDQPRWDRIIAAGHSQGAGHAAYLAKCFPLAGALMLSGPQDYLKVFHSPAPWLYRKGRTDAARQYAFLHVKDPFNYQFQVADVAAATGLNAGDTTMVQPGQPVRSSRHIFVNSLETRDYHGSTMNPVFVQVWQYILDRIAGR
jgi:pimeloyl-ACP methyl ester carboxylesterase